MNMQKLSYNTTLEGYILNYEFSKIAKISSNAYRFWKGITAAKYDECRVVFLKIDTIPDRYKDIAKKCTKLDGFVQSQAFCKYTGLASSHLIKSNNSKIYKFLEILDIDRVKFVNLKKFYDDLELDYSYHIYIEKCKYFGPSPLEKKIKLTDNICVGYY